VGLDCIQSWDWVVRVVGLDSIQSETGRRPFARRKRGRMRLNSQFATARLLAGSFALALAGCDRTPTNAPSAGPLPPSPRTVAAAGSAAERAHDEDDHAAEGHSHAASHGGTLTELGEHFATVEFVLDGEAGTLTAYVMDGCAEKPVRLAQPEITIELASITSASNAALPIATAMQARASALSGETVGDSACFELAQDALKGASAVSGTIALIHVKGSEFRNVAFTAKQGSPTAGRNSVPQDK